MKTMAKGGFAWAFALILVFAACDNPVDTPYRKLPELSGTVTITGTAEVGVMLTADISALDGTGTPAFEWRRGSSPEAIGTGSTYTVAFADIERTLTVKVTRTGYAGSIFSESTAAVPNPPNLAQSITSFKLLKGDIGWDEDLTGTINQNTKTITFITQKWIDNIDNLAAVYELDKSGAVVLANGTRQESGKTKNDFRRDIVYQLSNKVQYTVQFESPQATGLPVIRIDTDDPTISPRDESKFNRETWVTMTFSLSDPNNQKNDIPAISNQQIRGRGNSSWGAPKKPYRIRFRENQEQAPFGLPAARNWVLLANYVDGTLLGNSVAFELGQRLGLEYTCSYNHVELFFNGRYEGSYLFTEHRQADPAGLGAPGRPKVDLNNGWFVEMDRWWDEEPRFKTSPWDMPIMIKTPENNITSMDNPLYAFVRNDWNRLAGLMDAQSFPGNGYRDMVDIDSLVKYFMVHIIVNNVDFNIPGSVYFYRDKGGKINAGPLWDFDRVFGYNQHNDPATARNDPYPHYHFFKRFFDDPEFTARWKAIWIENYSNNLITIPEFIDSMADKIRKSEAENLKRWPQGADPDETQIRPRSSFASRMRGMRNYAESRIYYLNTEYR